MSATFRITSFTHVALLAGVVSILVAAAAAAGVIPGVQSIGGGSHTGPLPGLPGLPPAGGPNSTRLPPSNGTGPSGTWGWTEVPTATAPSPRAGAALVYDAADGYTLLFGGCSAWGGLFWSHACTALGDTWILSNGNWTNITANLTVSPPARADAGIAYDSAEHQVVMFGGFDGPLLLDDTWTFIGGHWTQEHPAVSPSARFSMGMVGAPGDGNVVLFGGGNQTGANVFNDTWTYEAGDWTLVSTSVAPPPRFSMTMSYDPVDQYVLLFSGWSTNQRLSFGDSWTFVNGVWTNITTSNGPIPRNYAAMAFDPGLNASIMTGGHVVADAYSDTWAENSSAGWQHILTTTAPPPRWGLELTYDPTAGTLYLFGGVDANQVFYNDTWEFGPT